MNSKRPCAVVFVASMVALCALPSVAHGQAISGDLVGIVMDKSGAVIPNATVTVENIATGVKTTTTSNDRGEYRFVNLPVGTYRIEATASGFAKTTIANFQVELNKTSSAPITLDVGQYLTAIEVTSAAPPVNTTSPQIEN